MLNETIISWTNKTWNVWSGCKEVSAGCGRCYAKTIAESKKGSPAFPNGFGLTYRWHRLNDPLKLKEPHKIFVNSMSDLFWKEVTNEDILRVWEVMNKCHLGKIGHVFQILTKREQRLLQMDREGLLNWTPNIWQGVTIENKASLYRMEALKETKAQTKFISFEPLLDDLGPIDLSGIDWAIVGGESGRNYRPMEQSWARNIRDQCVEQGVAYFYKQDSAPRTETRPWLVEENGDRFKWEQMPGNLSEPVRV
mgnify:CR=1 FL=1